MLFSLIFDRYCEKIGLKNYLRRLVPAMIIVFVVFLGLNGFNEFKSFNFQEDGMKGFWTKIGFTILLAYIAAMTVPAIEDFIACRRNEIRPFFINVHSGLRYTKISVFELMLWIFRFSFIFALSVTFVYSLPVSLIIKSIKNKHGKTSDNEIEQKDN